MNPTRQTLMIVEDEKDVAFLLRDVLEEKGYRCLLESQGEKVVERVMTERPDLVLLDIKLIGIDGYTVCRRMKREPSIRDIPVIFITALNTEKDVIEAKEAGGVYFMSKPFDIHFLVRKIKDVLLRTPSEGVPQSIVRKVLYVQSGYLPDKPRSEDSPFLFFRETEFEVSLVRDPRDTLRKARENQPDVILLDLDGALLDVGTVAETLWRNKYTRTIPVVVLTSFPEKEGLNRRSIPSMAAVLQKPVTPQDLLQALRSVFHSSDAFRDSDSVLVSSEH